MLFVTSRPDVKRAGRFVVRIHGHGRRDDLLRVILRQIIRPIVVNRKPVFAIGQWDALDRFGQRLFVVQLLLHKHRLVPHELTHGADESFVGRHFGQEQRQVVNGLDFAHHRPGRCLQNIESPAFSPVGQGRVDDELEYPVRFMLHASDFLGVECLWEHQVTVLAEVLQVLACEFRFHRHALLLWLVFTCFGLHSRSPSKASFIYANRMDLLPQNLLCVCPVDQIIGGQHLHILDLVLYL